MFSMTIKLGFAGPHVVSRKIDFSGHPQGRLGPRHTPAATLARRGSPLAGPTEGSRESALAFVVELEAKGSDPRRSRLRHRECAAHGMWETGHPHRFLHAFDHEILNLHRDTAADVRVVSQPVIAVFNWLLLDPKDLSKRRHQVSHWATQLSSEQCGQLVELLLRRLVIDDPTDSPVSVAHLLWRFGQPRNSMSAHIDTLDLSALNVERDEEGASVAGSGLAWGDRAGTFEIAVAVLEVRALHAPAHGSAPKLPPQEPAQFIQACVAIMLGLRPDLSRGFVLFEPQEALELPKRTIHPLRRGVGDGEHEKPVQRRDHQRGNRVRIEPLVDEALSLSVSDQGSKRAVPGPDRLLEEGSQLLARPRTWGEGRPESPHGMADDPLDQGLLARKVVVEGGDVHPHLGGDIPRS